MDILALIPQFGGVIWTVLAFVVALSIIVAIHEYGHYIVGRWSGIHAEVFSLGFGPVLWSGVDRCGTRWQIAALPLGGYVKFAGDADAASGKDTDAMQSVARDPAALRRTMHGAPLWARAATVAAGPVFNFILSIAVFAGVAFTAGQMRDPLTVGELRPLPMADRGLQPGDVLLAIDGVQMPGLADESYADFIANLPRQPELTYTVERNGTTRDVEDAYLLPPVIAGLSPQSAALDVNMAEGDVITAIDGAPIFGFEQLKEAVEGSEGRALELDVWRGGEMLTFALVPRARDEPQPDGGFKTHWRIGVASGMSFEPAFETAAPFDALRAGVRRTTDVVTGTFSGIWNMAKGAISTCNISGPIRIAQISGQVADQGLVNFIVFIGVLSTAVGVFNLFPVPVLDGGHLMFFAYEAIAGKPPSDRVLRALMTVGIALVLTLMVFALGNDLFCP